MVLCWIRGFNNKRERLGDLSAATSNERVLVALTRASSFITLNSSTHCQQKAARIEQDGDFQPTAAVVVQTVDKEGAFYDAIQRILLAQGRSLIHNHGFHERVVHVLRDIWFKFLNVVHKEAQRCDRGEGGRGSNTRSVDESGSDVDEEERELEGDEDENDDDRQAAIPASGSLDDVFGGRRVWPSMTLGFIHLTLLKMRKGVMLSDL